MMQIAPDHSWYKWIRFWHEKTNSLGFEPGPTQTRLYSTVTEAC